MHDNYRSKRKDYRLVLRNFLNHLEVDRVKKLCAAAETDEKLFWKLLKGQRFSSQMSAFLVNGAFITEENDIRDMWADHFEVRVPSLLALILTTNLPIRFQLMFRTFFKTVSVIPRELLTSR